MISRLNFLSYSVDIAMPLLDCRHCYPSMPGVARLFWSRAKFENYLSFRVVLFKISDDKVTILQCRKKLVLLMLLLTIIDQISSSKRSMLLFLITEKGPRAAKISWRAALWPCLFYAMSTLETACLFHFDVNGHFPLWHSVWQLWLSLHFNGQ